MSDRKYRRICSEDDGEVFSSQGNSSTIAWCCGMDIRHLVTNLVMFTAGLVVGLVLNTSHPRDTREQLAQYSMVPCKFGVSL
jgi:hypothetical protein